jgi:energy-coupling factor transporter ATP-binding protein EcfA2
LPFRYINPMDKITTETKIILLLGDTGVGKSSFINCIHGIVGDEQKVSVAKTSDGIQSCTVEPGFYRVYHAILGDLLVIDTPGFNDTANISDVEIIKRIFIAFFNWDMKFAVDVLIYFNKAPDQRIRFKKDIDMFCKFFKVDPSFISKSGISLITNWKGISPKYQEKYERTVIESIRKDLNLSVIKWDNIYPVDKQVNNFFSFLLVF